MQRNKSSKFRLAEFLTAIIFTYLINSNFLFAQNENNVVILEHADSLIGDIIDGEEARQLIGNVKLRHGNTIITCDRAIQFRKSNRISMEGVVEIHDDTLRMVGMRGMYYANERVAEAFERVLLEDPHTTLRAAYGKYFMNDKKAYFNGNVVVEDTASVLTADELTYFRDEQKSIADGNVKIVNMKNGITIFGNHFEDYKKKNYSKVTNKPKIVQIDTNSIGEKDTLIVTAAVLESYRDSLEQLIATDSVKITRDGLAAEAGVCIYFTDTDSIILKKSPFVWYETGKHEDNQVSGESIFIKLKNRRLETVYIHGRAVAISRADTVLVNRFNQMTGQQMILQFVDDKINKITVISTATSLYYLFEDRKPNGMNITTGDQIEITFRDGKIDKIMAISGVEGKYYPEKMIKGNENDYNLPEFNWRINRPEIKY
ncbi:MAG: OstA-like protein [Bacteroidota bacterium]|nr:OstA-like protein [Bacteroidota bacterium]